MNFNVNKTDNYTQVAFSGRLDSVTATEIEASAIKEIENENRYIIIDCSGLDYISSSGLRLLMHLHKLAHTKQLKLSLCGLKSNIREIFDISGFSQIFIIHPDLETAINS